MVSLLVITHGKIGRSLLDEAAKMLGVCPMETRVIEVEPNSDADVMLDMGYAYSKELDKGDGVLVLTDMYGSTPSNIACKLQQQDHVRVIGGINLPMLIRVLNYPNLSIDELVVKALSGGKDGVLTCHLGEV